MSGTSLDGADVCWAKISRDKRWQYSFVKCATFPYPIELFDKLLAVGQLREAEILALDMELAIFFTRCVEKVLGTHRAELICSHGHTVFHDPSNGITRQIGSLRVLNELLKTPVVGDFRSADVALGGQGAPLVPIGDELLFGDYQSCLNLGGFANISFEHRGRRMAFDICAVNIVLNELARRIDLKYDDGGQVARGGAVVLELFDALNAQSYFSSPPPKSLGREWVESQLMPLINQYKVPTADLLRTFTEHIATQLAASIPVGKCLATGGGVRNRFLMERVSELSSAVVIAGDDLLVDYKEALIFALLGILKVEGEINVLSSVTGATHDHSSGVMVGFTS
jgi:anhydro-N-acetylmuramic acid kinase